MPYATRADLLEENEQLWTTVESIYDELGELLGTGCGQSSLPQQRGPVARPLRSGRERQNGGSGESQTTAPRRRTARARHPSAMDTTHERFVANCRCRKEESAPLAKPAERSA